MNFAQIHFAFAISNPTYFQDALLDSLNLVDLGFAKSARKAVHLRLLGNLFGKTG